MSFDRWASSLGGELHVYSDACTAYQDFLSFLRAVRGPARASVVVPSHLPPRLVQASRAAGCEVRFYEIAGACEPDLDSLEAAIGDDTIAILAVHYYGFPSRLDEVAEIARRRGAVLVEDCAPALGGEHAGRPLGTIGDAAIFSTRKMLLHPEGGLLRLGTRFADFWPRYHQRVASTWSLAQLVRQRAARLLARATASPDPLALDDRDRAPDAGPLRVTGPSRLTELRLRYGDVAHAIARRRRAFRTIAEHLPERRRVVPLHRALPDGVTPSAFPLLVTDGSRDEVQRALLAHGVVTRGSWPGSPFDTRHDGARRLASSLLELPVHQALTDAQIERAIAALAAIADTPRPRIATSAPVPAPDLATAA